MRAARRSAPWFCAAALACALATVVVSGGVFREGTTPAPRDPAIPTSGPLAATGHPSPDCCGSSPSWVPLKPAPAQSLPGSHRAEGVGATASVVIARALDVEGYAVKVAPDAINGEAVVMRGCGPSAPTFCVAVYSPTAGSTAATVPSAPAGGDLLPGAVPDTASGDLHLSGPVGAAYDAGQGQVFITDEGSDNVSVLNDTIDTVVAWVTVGAAPYGVAYDAAKGEVFVTNEGGNTVSVISDATDTVAATVSVGSDPVGAAYDGAKDEVFVTNADYNNVSVINATTDKVAAWVLVGRNPAEMAYDASKGEVFVTNAGANSVSVINDTTDTVVASVPVGTYPYGVAYDAGKGEVFVTNEDSDNVSVINDRTDTVVASVPVGFGPFGAAYDGAKDELFVTNSGTDNVSVINDTTDTVVATYPVGSEPSGMAYDSGKGELFVANYASGNVSVISVAAPSYTVTFATDPASCGRITFDGTPYANGGLAQVTAGSYGIGVTACTGYSLTSLTVTGSVSVSSGRATVSGAGGITATFGPRSSSAPGLLGLPGDDGYYLVGGVVAAVIAAVAAIVLVGRRKARPTGPPAPTGPDGEPPSSKTT